MTIQWNLPTNFYNTNFVQTTFGGTLNPFGATTQNTGLFDVQNFLSALPSFSTISTPKIPSFNYNTVTSGSSYASSSAISVSTSGANSSFWEKVGYSARAGVKLAKNALKSTVGFVSKCAKYVKNAICKSGLGKYESGNACDMVTIMRKNKKFKEINPAGVNLKTLPAGCVLVYGKGVAGYSKQYGHTEISTGDGRCVSDGITRNPRGIPTAIFVPVST